MSPLNAVLKKNPLILVTFDTSQLDRSLLNEVIPEKRYLILITLDVSQDDTSGFSDSLLMPTVFKSANKLPNDVTLVVTALLKSL